MTAATVLDRAGDQLGGFLPGFVGALALLLIGLLVAALLARAVRRGLAAAGLDDAAERWGVADVLERSGLGRSLSRIVGAAVRLTLSVVVVFAALTLLGLAFLSDSLNQSILFMPKVLAALVLVLAGIVLGALARSWVERTSAQLDLPVPLGPVAQALVVAVFAITAAAQVTVPIGFLVVILAILLGATVGAVGLACHWTTCAQTVAPRGGRDGPAGRRHDHPHPQPAAGRGGRRHRGRGPGALVAAGAIRRR